MLSPTISDFLMSAILGVGHVEFCSKMLYFTNALTYRYETWYGSSARCPEGAWEVSEQRRLVAKSNFHMLITLGAVDLFSQESPF